MLKYWGRGGGFFARISLPLPNPAVKKYLYRGEGGSTRLLLEKIECWKNCFLNI